MVRTPRPHAGEAGFTLVEVAVAALLLVIGVLAVVTISQVAIANGNVTKARDGANSLAREILEDARSVPYPKLDAATLTSQLQSQNGLPDADGAAGWQVKRNSVVYTIVPTVCTYDDIKDGLGRHDSTYCSDTASGTADTNPDDYRRVRVDLSWKVGNRTYSISQMSLVNNPGSAFAPSVTALTQNGSSTSPIYICTKTTSLAFSATTNYTPLDMN